MFGYRNPLSTIISILKDIKVTLDDILALAQSEDTQVKAAVAAIQTLGQQLQDALANGDQAKLQQIADLMTSDTAALTTALTPAPATAG